MTKRFPIMFDDLASAAQEQLLNFYGFESSTEGNWEVNPLCSLELEVEDNEEVPF